MSHIPNCRARYIKSPSNENQNTSEPNPYWEGYLNANDDDFIQGYDAAMENIANFFCNLFMYGETLEDSDYAPFNGRYTLSIDDDFMLSDKDEDEISDEELNKYSKASRFFKALKNCMLDFAECNRDDIIISFLENMPEEKYEANKNTWAMEEKIRRQRKDGVADEN